MEWGKSEFSYSTAPSNWSWHHLLFGHSSVRLLRQLPTPWKPRSPFNKNIIKFSAIIRLNGAEDLDYPPHTHTHPHPPSTVEIITGEIGSTFYSDEGHSFLWLSGRLLWFTYKRHACILTWRVHENIFLLIQFFNFWSQECESYRGVEGIFLVLYKPQYK